MLCLDIKPRGYFLARHDTVGVLDEGDAKAIARAYQSGERGGRVATLQENLREAFDILAQAETSGRA